MSLISENFVSVCMIEVYKAWYPPAGHTYLSKPYGSTRRTIK